jgi:predicted RNA binding protein YcfA (HicA-like mRNA interferase family)
MNARRVIRRIVDLGGEVVRQKGPHVRVRAGACFATVPDHGARDIPAGTIRSIERQLAPCLGEGWLRER